MSYIIFAKGVSNRHDEFVKELLSALARRGVNISNQKIGTVEQTMSVEYTDERGDMSIQSAQPDIKISYTASGGPEAAKGAATGAAAGGGLGLLAGIITGKANTDKVMAGIAGAITGGAVGAYKGAEKGMREKISFAKLLAMSVTDCERRLLSLEKMEKLAGQQNRRSRELLLKEKADVESLIERTQGQLDSLKTEEESKRAFAESHYLQNMARLSTSQNKDLGDRLSEAEKKRYEAELKRIESFYVMRTAQINSSISRLKQRMSIIEDKLANL